eukprot:TRINITY_DN13509_c0_g1_i1.p1 TRINITY_DN13509_c0_g1~~TRINITY_DN13509_c0_g1_i1.p1  ORF type:complete len:182 (+),score=13.26 TRINITY_DN13509_c0_g1_i1:124-669(+)
MKKVSAISNQSEFKSTESSDIAIFPNTPSVTSKYQAQVRKPTDFKLKQYNLFFLKNMASQNFTDIKKFFSRFSQEEIGYFFEKKGTDILAHQIIYSKNGIEELDFIFENIPSLSITKVLSQDDFYILKKFVTAALSQEARGIDSEELRAARINKFEFMAHFVGKEIFENIFSMTEVQPVLF